MFFVQVGWFYHAKSKYVILKGPLNYIWKCKLEFLHINFFAAVVLDINAKHFCALCGVLLTTSSLFVSNVKICPQLQQGFYSGAVALLQNTFK